MVLLQEERPLVAGQLREQELVLAAAVEQHLAQSHQRVRLLAFPFPIVLVFFELQEPVQVQHHIHYYRYSHRIHHLQSHRIDWVQEQEQA